jgi:hypothetical protein
MGEEKLRHGKEAVDEKTKEKKEEKNELKNGNKALEGKINVGKVVVVGTAVATALALGGCGASNGNGHSNDAETDGDVDQDGADVDNDSDKDTIEDIIEDGEVPGVCDREESPMAELDVTSEWGDGERTCSSTSGCVMGVTVGDEVVLTSDIGGEEVQENWKVVNISGNEVELEEAGEVGPDVARKRIVINDSGSFIWEEGVSQLTETTGRGVLTLVGACVEGTCENGVSADVSNAKGGTLITLYAGEESVRVLLTDKQKVEGVEVGGYSVDLELVKATGSTAYVVYSVSDGVSSAKAELGHPVREGQSVSALGVTIENGVSVDNEIEGCHTLAVELTISNGDRTVHNEWREGEVVTLLNGVEVKVEKVLAETVVNEDGAELIDQVNSPVLLTRVDTGKSFVLYRGETKDNLDGDSLTVDNVVVYKEE